MTVTARPTTAPSPARTGPSRTGPAAHLTHADVERLGRDLDAVRQAVLDSRGAADAAYIRRVITAQRLLELGGRVVLIAGSRKRPVWLLGTAMLATAKVLDNMEIGHNVLHGQWDWMRDPKIHSTTWDWDHASPTEQWQEAHNQKHHTYTNIVGHDEDLGYGIMRVDELQPWQPRYLAQPLLNAVNAAMFEWGIAIYDAELGAHLRSGEGFTPELRGRLARLAKKGGKQAAKDYVVHPLLSGRGARSTFTAALTANLVRNVWSHSVIMCGHFPEGVEAFELDELPVDEGRGEWYLRQMLGSANISGSPLLHLMSGNLSHQVEHHLFPDLPSNRYAEVAPQVQAICERYALPYNARPLPQQVASAWRKVLRLSLPDGWLEETDRSNLGPQLRRLGRMVRAGRQLP